MELFEHPLYAKVSERLFGPQDLGHLLASLRWLHEWRHLYKGTAAESDWRQVVWAVSRMRRAIEAGEDAGRWRGIIERNALLARDTWRAERVRLAHAGAAKKSAEVRTFSKDERRDLIEEKVRELWLSDSDGELAGNADATARCLDESGWLGAQEIELRLSTIADDIRKLMKAGKL